MWRCNSNINIPSTVYVCRQTLPAKSKWKFATSGGGGGKFWLCHISTTLQLEPDILPLWWMRDGLKNMKKSDENHSVHYEISAQNVNYHD